MPSLHEEHKKGKIFIKRIFVIFGIQMFLFFVLFSRLLFLQTFQFKKYKNKSEENRIKTVPIPPLRGNILDRNGNSLTVNRKSYRVLLYKNKNYNEDEVVDRFTKILNLSEKEKGKISKKLEKNKHRPIVSIADNLNWEELTKVEMNYYRLPGIAIESGHIRNYPFEETTAHLLGYVSIPSESEIPESPKKQELFLHPDYRIGKTGIEKFFDKNITGISGYRNVEVNAYGIPLREILVKDGKKGKDLQLTIDINLQEYVTERTKDLRGAVIVMDIHTGEILALTSMPSFNPNGFVEGISQEYWNELINHRAKPLNNKVISAVYPPGSTVKPIVALAALDKGWNEKKVINCLGAIWLRRRKFHCWKKEGHGRHDLVGALAESCNIYFAKLSLFTGIDKISEMAHKFGIGEEFNISLPDTKNGIMPDRKWKREVLNDVWVRGDTVNTGIGQGFTLMTPLQMAVMISRIANGGYPVEPFLVHDSEKRESNEKLFENESFGEETHLEIIKEAMYKAVNSRKGTAYWNRIKTKKYRMAGKTGTAQVIAKKKKDLMEEESEEVKEQFRNHGLFVAFAPYDKPKYGIAVVIEHGGHGSVSAVPVARDILLFAQRNNIGQEGEEELFLLPRHKTTE